MRTLGELKKIDFAADTNNVIYGFSEVVKQEVVKHLKELRNKRFYCVVCEKYNCDCGSSDCFKPTSVDIKIWCKNFFDINEVDLEETAAEMLYRLEWMHKGGLKNLLKLIKERSLQMMKGL